jgi:hypothetical protein
MRHGYVCLGLCPAAGELDDYDGASRIFELVVSLHKKVQDTSISVKVVKR